MNEPLGESNWRLPAAPAPSSRDGRRERVFDIEQRIGRYRNWMFLGLGAALLASGPRYGFDWLLALLAAVAIFAIADWRMRRSAWAETWIAIAWAIPVLLVGIGVVGTGGPSSPALSWFALFAVTLAWRFDRRGMAIAAAYLAAVFVLSAVAVDPAKVADEYPNVLLSAALIAGVGLLAGGLAYSERDYQRHSTHDPLTGALNRRALERLAEVPAPAVSATDGGDRLAFLLCDLDRFKRVNDELGHPAGDAALREIVSLLRSLLRPYDRLYRMGGEEFLVVIPGADEIAATATGERLRRAVQEAGICEVPLTISIGVAASASSNPDLSALIAEADRALYDAKHSGRNAVRCASEDGSAAGQPSSRPVMRL